MGALVASVGSRVAYHERQYSIELFRDGGEGAGTERILVRRDDLRTARALYRTAALTYPARLIMLCDRARGLERSDRPDYGGKQ